MKCVEVQNWSQFQCYSAWCQVFRHEYLGRHVQNILPTDPHAVNAAKRGREGAA